MEQTYNFEIIFQKLEEAKLEQNMYSEKTIITIQKIDETIKALKELYENVPQVETATLTKSR